MSWVMGQHRCLRWILTEFVALCSQRLLSIGENLVFLVEKQGSIPKKSASLRFHRNHMGMMCVEHVYSIRVGEHLWIPIRVFSQRPHHPRSTRTCPHVRLRAEQCGIKEVLWDL